MVGLKFSGSFKNCQSFLNSGPMLKTHVRNILDKYGRHGIDALQRNSPVDSGLTRDSWSYKVDGTTLYFFNSNYNQGVSIPILIQYGHATRGGSYVQPIDFINPALQPIFDKIMHEIDGEVSRL